MAARKRYALEPQQDGLPMNTSHDLEGHERQRDVPEDGPRHRLSARDPRREGARVVRVRADELVARFRRDPAARAQTA